ncbi:MAG: YtxH domain-containing protein [Niabella sp.]
MKNRNKILLGILGAAAAGVAVGLLFYTDEGKKTRKRMKNTANDWADSLGSLIASGKENLSDMSQKALKQAKRGLKKVKNKAEDAYSDVSDKVEANLS